MRNEFPVWCDECIQSCAAQQAALSAEGRGDEASFMQIRANVYGIARSVYTAMKGSLTEVKVRLTGIAGNWETALGEAERHGDNVRAHIEHIKLETAAVIQRRIAGLQEATSHE